MRARCVVAALAGSCLTAVALAQGSAQEALGFPGFSTQQPAHNAADSPPGGQTPQAQPRSVEIRPDAPQVTPPARRKSKIFKWVDANGRVHFGDAPRDKNAKEIKIRGAARTPPAPAPRDPQQGVNSEGTGRD